VYSTDHALLIYDGDCGVCSSSATWITTKWKKPHAAQAVPSQWLSEADLQALGLSADDLARILRSLNRRPRKTLGYTTPSEKFVEVVALSS
jgi:predicted DCC family thiol-disulfide oxidoreductase YuxK